MNWPRTQVRLPHGWRQMWDVGITGKLEGKCNEGHMGLACTGYRRPSRTVNSLYMIYLSKLSKNLLKLSASCSKHFLYLLKLDIIHSNSLSEIEVCSPTWYFSVLWDHVDYFCYTLSLKVRQKSHRGVSLGMSLTKTVRSCGPYQAFFQFRLFSKSKPYYSMRQNKGNWNYKHIQKTQYIIITSNN